MSEIPDHIVDRVAVAISGAPFPTASSRKKARAAIKAYQAALAPLDVDAVYAKLKVREALAKASA